jgi:hypothetical protein
MLKNIYYSIRYCSYRLYKEYKILDVLIIYLEEVGIKSIQTDKSFLGLKITFNDGTVLNTWNDNKWCAWMSEGYIQFSNDKKITWNGKMPSFEVLYKFKKAVTQYEGNKSKLNSDYSEYLPIKIQRKAKLQKLK